MAAMNKLDENMLITQSNKLTEAAHSLTLIEKRLVIAAAALHDPRIPHRDGHKVTFHVDDFVSVFGNMDRKGAYEDLATAAARLYNRSIRQIEEKRGRKIITDMRWVAFAQYNEGEATVTLGFTSYALPYLTLIHTEFTSYRLKHVGQLGSFYSVRLYELFVQYRKAGQRTISLDKLRDMLDLGDKYPRVNSLRQRVLDPALAEINKHTDLRVVMTPERKGRTVIGFYFDITQDDQIPLDLPEPAGNTVELRPPSPATSIPPPEEPAEEPIPYNGIEELQRREEAAIDAMIDKLLAKKAALKGETGGAT